MAYGKTLPLSALPLIVNTTMALIFVILNLKAEHFRCWMKLRWLLAVSMKNGVKKLSNFLFCYSAIDTVKKLIK